MKLITRDIDYAVRALCFMSEKKGENLVSVAELAKELQTPRPFLRKILQQLNRKRIVRSYKGNGGGFKLAVCAQEINLADLVQVFQGQVKFNQCIFKKRACPGIKSCNFRKRIGDIEQHVVSQLKAINIASLAS